MSTTKTEFERFSDWVTASLPKHQVHTAFQNALRSLLSAEFPNGTSIPEVYAVAGGRNDLIQYNQDGKRAVFELFCSPSQVPQDLRLLERVDANWKVAVLLDEQIQPKLAATFFRKKPEGLPFLWLSQVIMPSRAADCGAKLRQLLSTPTLHATSAPTARGPAIVQLAHAKDSIVAQTVEGDIHINHRKVVRPQIAREPGDITEQTAYEIQELIRELARTEELAGKHASYKNWQQYLKNRFKVESYRKLTVAQGEDAVKWLKQELGRITPSLRRTNNPEWRKRMYSGIWAAARELEWSHDQVHTFANAELDIKRPIISLTELGEQKLELLRNKLRYRSSHRS